LSPELVAIGLGLFSAVTLAAANMSVKMGGDVLVSRAFLSASAALLVLPAIFFVPAPTGNLGRAGLRAPAHFFYQVCMIRALRVASCRWSFP
jgi:hypothetical protein